MKKLTFNTLSIFILLGLVTITSTYIQAQTKAYRVSDRTVQRLLNRIEARTDTYKRDMNYALDRSRFDDTAKEDAIMGFITDFENSTDQLSQRFDAKKSINSDVTMVLDRAVMINNFMRENSLTSGSQRNWGYLKTDLSTLARYYNVSFDWNAPVAQKPTYTKPYRVSDNQVNALITRIETKTDNFKRRMNNALDRSTLNNTDSEDMIFAYITEFENATDKLKQNFDANKSVTADVDLVLTKASTINAFMVRNRLARGAEQNWLNLKQELDMLSGYYNIAFDWTKMPVDNTNVAFTVKANEVKSLLTTLEGKTDVFKRDMELALNRSVLNNSRSEDAINEYIDAFENATDKLKQNFDANKSTDMDVEDVLNKGAYIDTFMRDYRLLRPAERQWLLIKNDLDKLSNYYAVSWKWDRQYNPMTKFDSMLTGTYRLNSALSDDVDTVIENSIRLYPQSRERRVENNLKRRLISPDAIAIEKKNLEVTLASSVAPKVMFRADGVSRNETTANGKTIKVTSSTTYDGVSLSYEGERMNDFYVNFMPMSNGRLKVVRRINLENENETVTVASVYDKVENIAQFERINNFPILTTDNTSEFVVANGTELTTVLKTGEISTKASQNGDRFSMEVTSPNQYRGAIIEGRVISAKRSGILTGRANVSLDFDTIRLTNGQTYKFAGLIENVQLVSGEKVTVSNEGSVRDNNQTSKTAKRAGIGAGVGAILGAILGGGEGAAIGAGVGAAAGAGTVLAQGRDDVEIKEGSEFMITATAPATANVNR